MNDLCKHCEARPRATTLGLCPVCDATGGIRLLYHCTRHLSPEREDRLRVLSERARRRLPLFDDEPEDGWMKALRLIEKHRRVSRELLAEFRKLVDHLIERLTPKPN